MELRNTDKLPHDVARVLVPYLENLLKALKENLLSAVVFGSATGPDFVSGRSNINLALLVSDAEFSVLASCLRVVASGFKKGIVVPLFLTREFAATSADVFPIEFLDIRETGVAVYGEDAFKDFVPDPASLRLECEQQVKSNFLRTRQAFLETGLARGGLERVLTQSLNSLIPVLRAFLVLRGERPPRTKQDIVASACRQMSLPCKPFETVLRLRARRKGLTRQRGLRLVADYMGNLKRVASLVDSLSVEERP